MKSIHNFEVPLFVEPSQQFKRFFKEMRHPIDTASVSVSYWREKLTFAFRSKDGDERKSSVRPFPHTFVESRREHLENTISSFASKLNCTMSLIGDDCNMYLFLADLSNEEKTVYGTDTIAIIRCVVICRSVAKEMALTNFFTVVDMSPHNGR